MVNNLVEYYFAIIMLVDCKIAINTTIDNKKITNKKMDCKILLVTRSDVPNFLGIFWIFGLRVDHIN